MLDSETHTARHISPTSPHLMQVLAVTLIAGIVLSVVYAAGQQAARRSMFGPLLYYSRTVADFGGLKRYQADDSALPPDATRVVFMGDSITDFWPLPQYFPGKPFINRGISGQTTSQMLVRFRQDVLDLHPRSVVIQGGANDIMGRTGPMTSDQIEANIETMAELSHALGIHVVLCSLLPVGETMWMPSDKTKIVLVNAKLRGYAAQHGYSFVNFYGAMKDPGNNLPGALSKDGIHPLPSGYAVMAPLVDAAVNGNTRKTK